MKIVNSVITIFIVLAITVTSITSCSHSKWKAEYSDRYTYEYLTANYTRADMNLKHMHMAENSLGPFERSPAGHALYRAIKDVPIEEYLVMCTSALLLENIQLVKSKQGGPPMYEVLEWDLECVELLVSNHNVDASDLTYGKNKVNHRLGKLNDESVSEMQEYMRECLNAENYYNGEDEDFQEVTIDQKYVFIRVFFEKYENIVWDASIEKRDGNYYIIFWICDERRPDTDYSGKFVPVYMPLCESVSAQIREVLESAN